MIILCEGARGAGKSYLIDNFFAQNTDPNIIYYKFALSDYIKILNIEDLETGPGVHYFSISNIITILGIAGSLLKDKHIIFDRSIFSAYVWSIYRRRMNEDRLLEEFGAYLNRPEYRNCVVVDINRPEDFRGIDRIKTDVFDKFENYDIERSIYDKVFDVFKHDIVNPYKNNSAYGIVNTFDEESGHRFNKLIYDIINK